MELLLQRNHIFDACTIGDLFVDGGRECFVLEDRVREVAGQPVEAWTVAGVTAIPSGRYRVIIDASARFKRDLPHILDVPGFTGVRAHPGNSDVDTAGCLLLGSTWSAARPDLVGGSVAAFTALFGKLKAALDAGHECWIEIRNAAPELPLAA